MKRTFRPGPNTQVARCFHTATKLQDGRVLLIGGAGAQGIVTDTVEIYDPDTESLSPAANMNSPRSGHSAILLNNGKVLVSGGLLTYVDASPSFGTVLNTAQDTVELYDPVADTWTLLPVTMQEKSAGHTMSLLKSGDVLIVGSPTSTRTQVGSMASPVAFHAAALSPTGGDVIVQGGITGDFATYTARAQVGTHNGNCFTTLQPLGQNPGFPGNPATPRSHATLAPLYDGTFLITGGINGFTTYRDAFVYVEP
jgi:hypothetical protein